MNLPPARKCRVCGKTPGYPLYDEKCIFTTRGCAAVCNRSNRAPATTQALGTFRFRGVRPSHPIERILLAASRSCQAALGIPQTAPDGDKQLEAR